MLDEELYREVKRKAVDRGQPMRKVLEEALKAYLGLQGARGKKLRPKFGVYNAHVQGSLGREDIYREHLKSKYPVTTP